MNLSWICSGGSFHKTWSETSEDLKQSTLILWSPSSSVIFMWMIEYENCHALFLNSDASQIMYFLRMKLLSNWGGGSSLPTRAHFFIYCAFLRNFIANRNNKRVTVHYPQQNLTGIKHPRLAKRVQGEKQQQKPPMTPPSPPPTSPVHGNAYLISYCEEDVYLPKDPMKRAILLKIHHDICHLWVPSIKQWIYI